ncbi:peptidoglycan/LPS O-acetylase OafA/YrhL [Kibdelosporangium sp. 4NS15]|uniref:Peptidoglycan/LPS O-acetylase OafA/YrhL n=1 Tax=Kibdelosporangium persicum TaxID=2698649 RepID=A0ABX2F718_9PSEU|nr:acyltransferase [Kibdelosporangium persicum]NRN67057.1 peptidoglycan/LPS O-acetylase OafA/YrhL [Kibdelosporangium persicum]
MSAIPFVVRVRALRGKTVQTIDPRVHSRLPSLTGMRFAAALMVFLCHVADSRIFSAQGISDALPKFVSQLGFVGVSFFFILSGFVLTWTARANDTRRAFWRRRLVKIYPNHFVTMVIALGFMAAAGTVTLVDTFPSVLLVQAFIPQESAAFYANGVSWSLCAELVFYLSFPVLLPLVNRIRPERLWLWAGILVASIGLIAVIAQVFPDQPNISYYPIPWYKYWFVYTLPITRIPEFLLGIVMARIVLTGRWIPLSLGKALLLLIPGYALTITLPDVYGMVLPCALPLALIVAAGAVADVQGHRSPFRNRVAVWLGEISFAFYMVHLLVLMHGPMSAGTFQTWDVPAALGIIAVSLGMCVFAAWLLYALVERPIMRRFSKPRPRVKQVATV